MMINFKALLIGVAAIIFLGLTFELVFLFIDVSYNYLMKSYPGAVSFRQMFYYLVIFVGLFFVMFTGGYLTSLYAAKNVYLHSIIVGLISSGIALYATGSGYDFTLLSVLFVVVGIGFTLVGSLIWQRNNSQQTD